jgi:dihydroorotate dehydrogenase electron transfer subunit
LTGSRKEIMTEAPAPAPVSCTGTIQSNIPVSRGLIRMDLELDLSVDFLPGQFAMLNLPGPRAFVFGRPFSILEVGDGTMSFLYRVVGRGTETMAGLGKGEKMVMLGPLGRPFPAPEPGRSTILIAGGVGLPPVASWLARYGSQGDQAFFGARDGADAPWALLGDPWRVSVDAMDDLPAGKSAFHGLVTELVKSRSDLDGDGWDMLACGPEPLLKAAADLAADRGWRGWLSLEEHMGCGYGACKGCVVALKDDDPAGRGWRNATCCQEGPVFPAGDVVWNATAGAQTPASSCDLDGGSA